MRDLTPVNPIRFVVARTRVPGPNDNRRLGVALSDEEIAQRVADYERPEPQYTRGIMAKYAATVSSAAEGAITS